MTGFAGVHELSVLNPAGDHVNCLPSQGWVMCWATKEELEWR